MSGLLLGSAVMMSYGLPVLGVLALAVLVLARSWKPLPIAAAAAAAVVVAFVPFGFSWWSAYPVLKARYYDPNSVAVTRPAAYWLWGDLADLLLSGGPVLAAGIAVAGWFGVRAVRRRRAGSAGVDAVDGVDGADAVDGAAGAPGPDVRSDHETRTLVLLSGAGLLMALIADASLMSRAEVERIWLPFIPWITVSLALLPPRWRRWGFAVQVLTAVLIEQLLVTQW